MPERSDSGTESLPDGWEVEYDNEGRVVAWGPNHERLDMWFDAPEDHTVTEFESHFEVQFKFDFDGDVDSLRDGVGEIAEVVSKVAGGAP